MLGKRSDNGISTILKVSLNRMRLPLSKVIDVACLGLASSVVMDSYLWVTQGYLIPCWTMAAMSLGVILLLQTIKVFKTERPKENSVLTPILD